MLTWHTGSQKAKQFVKCQELEPLSGISCGMWSIAAIWEEDGALPCVIPSALVLCAGPAQRMLAAVHLCVP